MSTKVSPRWARAGGALAALALLGTACSSDAKNVTVTAKDYSFSNLPGSVKVGSTLTLTNASTKELHELVLMRLPDTEKRPVKDLVKLPEKDLDALFQGPPTMVLISPPGGGQEIKAVGDGKLTQKGRYLVMCAIPTGADPAAYLKAAQAASQNPQGGPPQVPGGPPHFTQGMFGEITVK